MVGSGVIFVTQVSPYLHGPAGAHGVLDQSATAMAELAELGGMGFRRVSDVRTVTPADLGSATVLALFTIGETPWSAEQRTAILDAVRSGRTSVLAVHSATDANHGWDEYGLLVGARFDGHPWTKRCTLDVVDPTHPAVSHLGSTWEWHDEIYTFRDLRPDATVLLRARSEELPLDPSTEGGRPRFGYPLSWYFTEGAGRVFSTSLGHFPHAWETPDYLTHLRGGLDWLTEPDRSGPV
jgi:uncharacterized protein